MKGNKALKSLPANPASVILLSDTMANTADNTVQEMLKRHVQMRAELPRLLAETVRRGWQKEAVEKLLAWGEGAKPLQIIWEELASLPP